MTDELENMTPNQRRALSKGLAALETMAGLWAAEIRLSEMAQRIADVTDAAERAKRIAAFVEQGFIEGAYRHYIDHKDQIAALESAAKGEPVAEIIRSTLDHPFGTHDLVAAIVLDAGKSLPEGAKLYTAPAATDNGGGRDAVTDAQVEAALAAFNAFPCPMNGCISRSGNAEQMRAAIDAALSQKAGEQQ